VRGDIRGARRELEKALALVQAGDHQLWPNIAGAHLRVLYEMGDSEAVAVGRRYVEDGEKLGLGYALGFVLSPYTLALAKSGAHAEAVVAADRAIEALKSRGVTGLCLALAYEARARVALHAHDAEGFERYEALYNETIGAANNPALVAKAERLKRDAQRAELSAAHVGMRPLELSELFTVSRIVSTLDACRGVTARAQAALSLLTQASGTTEGVLYLVGEQGAFCAAQLGERAVPASIHALAQEYLATEVKESDTTTNSGSLGTSARYDSQWAGPAGETYRPVLLSHQTSMGVVITGVALLVVQPDGRFTFPGRVATEISRRTQQTGDVTGMVVSS
jgi:hypothetical protein